MRRDVVERTARRWIRKVESDLRMIALALPAEDVPFDMVCFHAQQAAEKYLKALLMFRGVRFARTHDLADLVGLLPSDSTLPAGVGDLTDLADAAVEARYPDQGDEIEYGRALAERLVAQAQAVKDEAVKELARLGYPFDLGKTG